MTKDEVARLARPGESWEEARRRLKRIVPAFVKGHKRCDFFASCIEVVNTFGIDNGTTVRVRRSDQDRPES